VNGDQVRDNWFCRAGAARVAGYDPQQVEALCRRVAAELDAGGSAGPLIQDASFRRLGFGLRYDIDAVDWFLDQFLLPPGYVDLGGIGEDPWGDLPVARVAQASGEKYAFELQCDSAWRDFGQVRGTHLWFGKAARGSTELRTAEQRTLASVRGIWRRTFSVDGAIFTLQRPSAEESSSPAVAELLARAARDEAGHYADYTPGRVILPELRIGPDLHPRGLADGAGTPILYTAGDHYNWRAGTCILFPDQRWLRFPVRGSRPANAIMTAVDRAGNRVARYRLTDKSGHQKKSLSWSEGSVEIIVHPGQKLTDELALALALSADWLGRYFARPEGGG
jgi:hypothetical protein